MKSGNKYLKRSCVTAAKFECKERFPGIQQWQLILTTGRQERKAPTATLRLGDYSEYSTMAATNARAARERRACVEYTSARPVDARTRRGYEQFVADITINQPYVRCRTTITASRYVGRLSFSLPLSFSPSIVAVNVNGQADGQTDKPLLFSPDLRAVVCGETLTAKI